MGYMKKHLSILLVFVLMIGNLFSFTPLDYKAYAKENSGQALTSSADLQEKLIEELIERQNALDFSKFSKETDDNTVTDSTYKIDPNQNVRVVVELNGKSTIETAKLQNKSLKSALASEDKVAKAQKTVIDKVKGFGKVRYSYQNVINGFSADVKYKDIDSIKEMYGVKSVKIVNVYYPDIDETTGTARTDDVWTAIPDTKGLNGEGIVVAIIDTGIDYNHKDMRLSDTTVPKLTETNPAGPGRYFSEKVPYGYNFADKNQDIVDRTDTGASMHGMHVAGIVAANATDEDLATGKGIRGCAPEAQLLAMKVFSNNSAMGGASSDDIIAAIEDSVKHGADVINMSLGASAGFVSDDDPEQIAVKAAVDAGVVVVASAGNSSYSGYGYHSPYATDPDMGVNGTPGNAHDTIEVASSENAFVSSYALDYKNAADGESGTIVYLASEKEPYVMLDQEYHLVDCGLGNYGDFYGKDLNGKIALIERGGSSFVDKKMNAQYAGAIGAIIYNSKEGGDGYISMQTDSSIFIPAVFIGRTDGLKLKNSIDTVTVSFNGKLKSALNSEAGKISAFSSWGTPNDLSFKPNITAPGGNILSTVNNNEYMNMSGTSMSSPYTAGDVALLVQYLKNKNTRDRAFVELAKKILLNTAKPIMDPSTGKDNLPYLARVQGAGLINITDAVTTNAYVENSEDREAYIELKEIGDKTQFKFTIYNFGSKNLTFNIKDNYGVLSNACSNEQGTDFLEAYASNVDGARLSFDKNTVTVPANGGAIEVAATLDVPSAFSNRFVEGFITLESTIEGQPSLGIPYMGFHGDWCEPRVIDSPAWETDNVFYGDTLLRTYSVYGNHKQVLELGVDYDAYGSEFINPDKNIFSPNGDGYYEVAWPFINPIRNIKELKVDVYDANNNLIKNVAVESNITKTISDESTASIANEAWAWDGTDNKGNKVPDGQYDIKVSGKIAYEGAEFQSIDMPVKIDTKAPVLDPKIERVDGNKFKVTFNGTDDSGIAIYQALAYNSKGTMINDWAAWAPNNSVVIELPNDKCTIQISASDNVINYAVTTLEFDNTSVESSFDIGCDTVVSPYDGTIYVPKNSMKFNYSINPALIESEDPAETLTFKMTNSPTEILTELNGTIEKNNLMDGLYNVSLDTISRSGKLLGIDEKKFIIDTNPPELDILDPVQEVTSVTGGQTTYTMQVRVKDISGYDLYVNGNLMYSIYGSTGDGNDTDITWSIPVDLKPGENTSVTLRVVDRTGHEVTKKVSFTCDPVVINIIEACPLLTKTQSGRDYQSLNVKVSGNLSYNKETTTISELKINNDYVPISDDGSFEKVITLPYYGFNIITVTAVTDAGFVASNSTGINISAISNYGDEDNNLYKVNDYEFATNKDTDIDLPYNVSSFNNMILDHMLVFVDSREPINIFSPAGEGKVTIDHLTHVSHNVRFELYGQGNLLIASKTITLNVDKDEPNITYFSISGDGNSFMVTVGCNEQLRKITIAGQIPEESYGSYTTTIDNLSDGKNYIEIYLEDMAGNTNTFVERVYNDTTPPEVDIDGYSDDVITVDASTETYSLNITASDNVVGYMLYVDQAMIGYSEAPLYDGVGSEKTFSYDYPLNTGINVISVKAVDAFGNETVKSIKVKRETPEETETNLAVKAVEDKIVAIGEVTLESEAAIKEARSAYEALSEEAKALVKNLDVLEEAEKKLEKLKNHQQEIQESAAQVQNLIDSLGEITLASEDAVKEARSAYEALSEEAKALVKNLDILEEAEKNLEELKNHQQEIHESVAQVENLIDSLGEITLDSKDAVKEARSAYEALSDEAKALVKNLDVLERSERKLDELEKGSKPVNTGDTTDLSGIMLTLMSSLCIIFVILAKKIRHAREI